MLVLVILVRLPSLEMILTFYWTHLLFLLYNLPSVFWIVTLYIGIWYFQKLKAH